MSKNIKFTTTLPEETIKKLKMKAIEEHSSCSKIIIELVEKYIDNKKEVE